MRFIIKNDKLTIADAKTINSGSINDYLIDVETDDSWDGLTISAKICQEQEGTAIERAVINGKVYIDIDKLEKYKIGFIGYTIEDDEKVYQKSTDLKVVPYIKGAGELEVVGEQEVPTPAEWEVYLQEVSDFIDNANDILDNASNLDIDVSKSGEITTVTITKQDETTKQVQILDGEDYTITQEDYQAIADIVESQIDFIDKNVNDLTYYTLTTQTGSKIDLELNNSNYQLKAKLYDKNNNLISTSSTIDLPIESMVVNASYSNGILTLTLQNGTSIDVDISSIVSGLVTPEDLADYVKNTDYATSSKGGVIKVSQNYGSYLDSNGILRGYVSDYQNYQSTYNSTLISKGTLEAVITGKGLISDTDIATTSKNGVIRASDSYQTSVDTGGSFRTRTVAYSTYQTMSNNAFVGKGTLENVITGKDLTTKAYVDNIVGDIESILHTLNTGSGV